MIFYLNYWRHGYSKRHQLICHDHETVELTKRLLIFRMDIERVEFENVMGRVFYRWEKGHGLKDETGKRAT